MRAHMSARKSQCGLAAPRGHRYHREKNARRLALPEAEGLALGAAGGRAEPPCCCAFEQLHFVTLHIFSGRCGRAVRAVSEIVSMTKRTMAGARGVIGYCCAGPSDGGADDLSETPFFRTGGSLPAFVPEPPPHRSGHAHPDPTHVTQRLASPGYLVWRLPAGSGALYEDGGCLTLKSVVHVCRSSVATKIDEALLIFILHRVGDEASIARHRRPKVHTYTERHARKFDRVNVLAQFDLYSCGEDAKIEMPRSAFVRYCRHTGSADPSSRSRW